MSLSLDLLSRLKKDILQGKFPRGHKLTEQRLCSEYRVSRTPVREALQQLERDGLIEIIPNRGAFALGVTRRDLSDAFALRKLYEVQAVEWAIERIADDEFAVLEETFEFMAFYTAKGDFEKMLNINANFHQLIYAASHNKTLQHILSSYQSYIRYARKQTAFADDYLPTLLEEHRKIFEAFRDADAARGIEAARAHMDNALARHRETFEALRPKA